MSTRTYRLSISTVAPSSRTHRVIVTAPSALISRTYRVMATAPPTPHPNAGPDMVDLEPWHRVQLNGSETSSVGASVEQRWVQASGTPVEVLQSNTPNAFYWAPGSMDGETLVFEYHVKGSDGTWSPADEVTHRFLPTAEFAAIGGRLVPMGIIAITSGSSLGNLTQ